MVIFMDLEVSDGTRALGHWQTADQRGDIFELDLALPLTLGAHVHLMVRNETPPYEVTFVDGHERGASYRALSGILTWL